MKKTGGEVKKGTPGDAPKAPLTYLQVSTVRGHFCPLLPSLPLSDPAAPPREAPGCCSPPPGWVGVSGGGRAPGATPHARIPSTHASRARTLSQANFTRAISHTPAHTLHTPWRAHVLTHTPMHRLAGSHAFSHTFTRILFTLTLSHTQPLLFAPSYIDTLLYSHSHAYKPPLKL